MDPRQAMAQYHPAALAIRRKWIWMYPYPCLGLWWTYHQWCRDQCWEEPANPYQDWCAPVHRIRGFLAWMWHLQYSRCHSTLWGFQQKDICFIVTSDGSNSYVFVQEKEDDRLHVTVIKQSHASNLFQIPCESKRLNIVHVTQKDIEREQDTLVQKIYTSIYMLNTEVRQKRMRKKLKTFTKQKSTIRKQQSAVSRQKWQRVSLQDWKKLAKKYR